MRPPVTNTAHYAGDMNEITDTTTNNAADDATAPAMGTQTTRPPLWRRLLRRDAGFGVLVLAVLLVTVLVISRPATPPTQHTRQLPAQVNSANARIFPMPNPTAGLMQPAVDAQGNIWVGEMTANKLARIDPQTGQVTEWTPPNGQHNIMEAAIDRQGQVWFTEQLANYIGRFDPTTQTFTVYSLDAAIGPRMAPQDLAFDASGRLWFTLLGGRIGRLDPATGAIQSWAVPLPAGTSRAYPFSLAVTPEGVWFGYLSGGAVGRLDPATGATTLMPLKHPQAAIYAMAADATGHVWFTEMQPAILGMINAKTGTVTEIAVPKLAGDPSMLYGVVTTSDSAVWFASAGSNAVVRYQAETQSFRFYPLPTSQSIPFGLALGHDGSIWVSGDGATDNYVARMTP
jgi:virginiamycin B lyase